VSWLVTLRLDEAALGTFDRLRRLYFPPERNFIDAHLTLFHQLPESEEVEASLLAAVRGRRRFPLEVTGLRSLGRGVAYTLDAPMLMELHRELAAVFEPYLIQQDRQRFQPHIVVQNKVSAEEARALLAELRRDPLTLPVEALGLQLWEYLGGPWRHVRTFRFD
jgi:2'-5' RNA ligase